MVDLDNVIQFPVERRNAPPQNEEDVLLSVEYYRLCHIQDSLELVIPTLFNQLNILGFTSFAEDDLNAERFSAMIVETIRSYMCANHEIDHPFHDIARGIFTTDSENNLSLDQNMKVVLRRKIKPSTDPNGKKKKTPKQET